MKCKQCGVEMVDMYGVSMYDQYAVEFRGNTGEKYGTPIDLVYCPKCGNVKAIEQRTEGACHE